MLFVFDFHFFVLQGTLYQESFEGDQCSGTHGHCEVWIQATIDQIVYLAILMPIVASMGGVAGTQTLTIMIRGLTLQQINQSNLKWLYKREIAVSIVNGILLSILVGGITYLWFDDMIIATLICIAMVTNLIFSAIAGIFIPIILRKFNQDPAIAGSVVVTTVTDVIGFFSFLGLATVFLV